MDFGIWNVVWISNFRLNRFNMYFGFRIVDLDLKF